MTNEKSIQLVNVLRKIETEFFKSESKFDISRTLYHATCQNIRRLKPIVKELEDIEQDVRTDFKKSNSITDEILEDKAKEKEIDAQFFAFRNSKETQKIFTDFYEAENSVELYKVDREVVEEAILPVDYYEVLEQLIK